MDIGPAVYLVLTWKRLLTFWGPFFSDLKPQSAALTRNCNTPLCRQSKCSFLDNLDDLVARLCVSERVDADVGDEVSRDLSRVERVLARDE